MLNYLTNINVQGTVTISDLLTANGGINLTENLLNFGTLNNDMSLSHDGSNGYLDVDTGDFYIRNSSNQNSLTLSQSSNLSILGNIAGVNLTASGTLDVTGQTTLRSLLDIVGAGVSLDDTQFITWNTGTRLAGSGSTLVFQTVSLDRYVIDASGNHNFQAGNIATTGTITGNRLYSNNQATANNELVRLDQLNSIIAGLDWQESVLDQLNLVSSEPASPTVGDRYISLATGTSSATSQAVTIHYIYEWNGTDWTEFIPNEGWTVWVEDVDTNFTYNGSTWVEFGSTVSHNNTTGLQGGQASQYYHLNLSDYTNLTADPGNIAYTNVNNNFTASQNIGGGSASEYALQIGHGRTGNGHAYIDLVGDETYTNFGLRVIRGSSGANAYSAIIHRGTGNFELISDDAGDIKLRVDGGGNIIHDISGTNILTVDSTGVDITGSLDVSGSAAFNDNVIIDPAGSGTNIASSLVTVKNTSTSTSTNVPGQFIDISRNNSTITTTAETTGLVSRVTSTSTVQDFGIRGAQLIGRHSGAGSADFAYGTSNVGESNGTGSVGFVVGTLSKSKITGTGTITTDYARGTSTNTEVNNPNATVNNVQGIHSTINLGDGTIGNAYVALLDFDYTGTGNISGDFAYLRIQNDTLPSIGGTGYAIRSLSTLPSTFSGKITATDLEINLVGTDTAIIYGENDAQFRVRGTNDHWSGIGFLGSTGNEGYLYYNSVGGYFRFTEEVQLDNSLEVGTDTSDASTILRRQNTGDYIQLYRSGINVGNISASSQGLRLWGLNSVVINPDSLDVDFYVYSDVNTAILVDGATGNTTFGGDVYINSGHIRVINTYLSQYDSANTDITSLVSGSTFGALLEGPSAGHVVIGIKGNDTGDGFSIIGSSDYNITPSYDELLFEVNLGGAILNKDLTMNGDIKMGDSDIAYFGTGYDLRVYHNGSNSYIQDSGTGELRVLASTFSLRNSGDTELMLTAVQDGAVNLYHNNNLKLLTTSSGVDVNGSISATDGTNTTKVLAYGITFDRTSNYIRPTTNGGGELFIGGSIKGENDYTNVKVYTDGTNDFKWNDEVIATQNWVDTNYAVADKALSLTLRVKNTESVALSKGQVVCAAPSATPPSGNVIEVKLADNNGTDSMPAIGILNEDLDAAGGANDEGEAIMFGRVSGIDTSAFSVGDEVFVSDTAGGLTTTKPTGVKYIQKVGVVVRDSASNGTIEVFGAGRTNDLPTPLYVDHTNQRLGIGTSSPTAKLDVNGNTNITGTLDVSGTVEASSYKISNATVLSGSGTVQLGSSGATSNINLTTSSGNAVEISGLNSTFGGFATFEAKARVEGTATDSSDFVNNPYHLELRSPDTLDSLDYISLRFHHINQTSGSIRYNSQGFYFQAGNSSTYRDVYVRDLISSRDVIATGDVQADEVLTTTLRTSNGQQLVLNAGESVSHATGQTGENVYINAESGLEINYSPDNWTSLWAGRKTHLLGKDAVTLREDTTIYGSASDTSSNALTVRNLADTTLFSVRNDGRIDFSGPMYGDVFAATGGTFTSATDSATNAGFVIESGDYIYGHISGNYLRKLLGINGSILEIGHPGTSLISEIVLKPGNSNIIKGEGRFQSDYDLDVSSYGAFHVERTLGSSRTTSNRGFADATIWNGNTSSLGYAGVDIRTNMNNGTYDHMTSFQARPSFDATTITDVEGVFSYADYVHDSTITNFTCFSADKPFTFDNSTITNFYGLKTAAGAGINGASITNFYGMYIGNGTVTATNKWGIYIDDANIDSWHKGEFSIGGTAPATADYDFQANKAVFKKPAYFEADYSTAVSTVFTLDVEKQVNELYLHAGNFSISNTISNISSTAGLIITIIIAQDDTGSRTITSWGTGIEFGDAGAPTLSTGANKMDMLSFYSDGYKLFFMGIQKGFSNYTIVTQV